jgi:hypothetical protein
VGDVGDAFEGWSEDRSARHAEWYAENMAALRASGLRFEERPTSVLFREPGKPRVDFYPHTGRWRVVGERPDPKARRRGADGRTLRGGAKAFLGWYAKQEARHA